MIFYDKFLVMRNLLIIILLIVLCSNECSKPYNAKVICASGKKECKVEIHNSLEFSVHWADVNLWKHRIEVAVRYRITNTSNTQTDSINYNGFSLVSSKGIKLSPWRRKNIGNTVTSFMYGVAPAGKADSILIFYSADKYSKGKGLDLLKSDSFYLVYFEHQADTICKIEADDKHLR